MAINIKIKNEKDLSRLVHNSLSGIGHCQRHEDKHCAGIPDISFAFDRYNGWLELKHVKCSTWNISHFTTKQRRWLKNRGRCGSYCALVVHFSGMIYFIPWYIFKHDSTNTIYQITTPKNSWLSCECNHRSTTMALISLMDNWIEAEIF